MNWTKQKIIVTAALVTASFFLLLPALLTPDVHSSANKKIATTPSFLWHAAKDTAELALWFGWDLQEHDSTALNSIPESTPEKIVWLQKTETASQKVALVGLTPTGDPLLVQVQLAGGEGETEIKLSATRSCGYFSRLWKWMLSWQDKRTLQLNLKQLESLVLERANQNKYYGFVVSEIGLTQQHFTGYRATVAQQDLFRFFGHNVQTIYSLAQRERMQTQGRACLLRYSGGINADSADVFVGIPAPAYTQLAGTQSTVLPAGTYAATMASGDEEQIRMARQAIRMYLADRNLTLKMPFAEEYIHETAANPDPSRWKTKVFAAYK